MKTALSLILVLVFALPNVAQTPADSLWQEWLDENQTDSLRIDAVTKLIWNHYLFVDQDSALIICSDLYDFAQNAGRKINASSALRNMGVAYYYKGIYDSAEYYYNRSLAIDSVIGYSKGLASGSLNLGLLYSDQGDFLKSVDYYLKGLSINEQLRDSVAMAATLTNMGGMYYHQGNLEDAQHYFQRSYDLYVALSDLGGQAMCLNNLGLMLQGQGKYEEAIVLHLRCLDISIERGFKLRMTNSYDNLGTIYIDIGKLDKALEYYQSGLDVSREIKSMSGITSALGGLASVHFKKGDSKTAKRYAEEAYALTQEAEVGLPIQENIADLLYQLYKAEGNNELALKMLEESVNYRDSLKNEETQRDVMRQSFQHETEKKEQEIELLNATSERNAAQRNLFIGLTIGFLLLLGTGGYFMIRIRNQNRVIELALEEKNVLLKEIHHRVKNNLQMISSLLGLQSRYTSDETASKALKESQGRVTSVSLIHQRLYSETNLTGVFMPEYIQELTEELLYSANADDMEVSLNIDDLNLDIDTVIPLGLIINELITNAIKYGRKDAGSLNISLHEENNILSLIVSDRGPGFPPDFNPKITNSYGMKLIRSLSDKLKANTSFNNLADGGAQVRIDIHKYKHAA